MNKKGFTLIELLAVIIILGILMMIAIPSISTYVLNSKKDTFIATAGEYINATTDMVNSGEYDVYDPMVTYYVPLSCIALEKGGQSPFGDIKDGYVLVTYNEEGFDYYFQVYDSSGMGMRITRAEDLSIDRIKSGLRKVDTTVGVGGRFKIKIMDKNTCKFGEEQDTEKPYGELNILANSDNYTMTDNYTFSSTEVKDFKFYDIQTPGGSPVFRGTFKSEIHARYPYNHSAGAYLEYTDEKGYRKFERYAVTPTVIDNKTGKEIKVVGVYLFTKEKYTDRNGDITYSFSCNLKGTGHLHAECKTSSNLKFDMCIPKSNGFCDEYISGGGYIELENGDAIDTQEYYSKHGYNRSYTNVLGYTYGQYRHISYFSYIAP